MSDLLLPPDVRRMFGDLARRIGILERRVTPKPAATFDGGVGLYLPIQLWSHTNPTSQATYAKTVVSPGAAGSVTLGPCQLPADPDYGFEIAGVLRAPVFAGIGALHWYWFVTNLDGTELIRASAVNQPVTSGAFVPIPPVAEWGIDYQEGSNLTLEDAGPPRETRIGASASGPYWSTLNVEFLIA